MNIRTQHFINHNYFGIVNNQIVGACPSRNETYIFHIYNDGSHTILVKDNEHPEHVYAFGGIDYFRVLKRKGLLNLEHHVLTPEFLKAVEG